MKGAFHVRQRPTSDREAAIEVERCSGTRPQAPLFSVVIVSRNQAGMLAEAAQAVLRQDLEDEFELIVVDDHSDDGTEAAMDSLLEEAERPLVYLRHACQIGPGGGRNTGLRASRGRLVAFTDSDCLPEPGWLRALRGAFADPAVGVVQGRTLGTQTRVRLFEHHVETLGLDGTFATANCAYRREAVADLAFNPACWYWEDVDMGWRVLERGWRPAFAPEAVVRHRIMPMRALDWILWPSHLSVRPAIARRHPSFRRHLWGGLWVRPMHLWFELAAAGALLALRWWPALLLAVPYLVAFARSRGLRGRFPPAKAAAYVARDAVTLAALLVGSVRHRALVL